MQNTATQQQKLLDSKEAAAFLGLSRQTLANWRYLGKGPNYITYGNKIIYLISDLEKYRQKQQIKPVLN